MTSMLLCQIVLWYASMHWRYELSWCQTIINHIFCDIITWPSGYCEQFYVWSELPKKIIKPFLDLFLIRNILLESYIPSLWRISIQFYQTSIWSNHKIPNRKRVLYLDDDDNKQFAFSKLFILLKFRISIPYKIK